MAKKLKKTSDIKCEYHIVKALENGLIGLVQEVAHNKEHPLHKQAYYLLQSTSVFVRKRG